MAMKSVLLTKKNCAATHSSYITFTQPAISIIQIVASNMSFI